MNGKLVSFFMNLQIRPMYEEAIRFLSLSGGESVLDIGCGNGYVLNMIAKKYNGSFTGIDISGSIIRAAISRNRKAVDSNKMMFSCQNMSAMTFSDDSFDRVYTINTVYFWDNIPNVMNEISRVLKVGGLFVNTLFTNETLEGYPHTKYGYKKHSEKELTEAGTNIGFDVDIVPILNGKASCYVYSKSAHRKG